MNREHEVLNAFAEALREAQITGLAFIRVNANGHIQVLPSDRVQLSVIQAVEEQEARTRVVRAAEYWKSQDPAKLEAMCDDALNNQCGNDWQSEFDGVGYEDICSKCGAIK